MIRRPYVNVNCTKRLRNSSLELCIQASYQDLGRIATAPMDCKNVVTAGEQLKAPWLVKSVTRQMQSGVVPGAT
jgi:hypothetical protein